MKKLLYLLLSIIILLSCSEDKSQEFQDSVLDIRLKNDPKVLNPIFYSGSIARLVHQYLYLPLADYDPKSYELIPVLLESLPEETITEDGGQEFTMKLRDEAQWDDGKPITAADYLFTVKCILNPSLKAGKLSGFFENITKIEMDSDDPKKMVVTLDEYYMLARNSVVSIPLFPHHIYDPQGITTPLTIMSVRDTTATLKNVKDIDAYHAWLETMNSIKYLREEVNNSGPYKLVSWDADRSLVLEKKENYWGRNIDNPFMQQGPDKMNFYILPDEATVMSQLKDGKLDVVNGISTSSFNDLKHNEVYQDDFSYYNPSLSRYYYLSINNAHPILSDVDVRKALAHLIDVDKMISSIEEGYGTRLASLVLPVRSYYNEALQPIPFDPDKAREILANDGWKDVDGDGDLDKTIQGRIQDLTLDVYVSEQALGRYVALMLQENARSIGVNINIVTKPFSSYLKENVATRDYGLAALVSIREVAEDDDFYQSWHSDNDSPSLSNYYSYRDKEADRIIEKIRNTRSKKERAVLYKNLQEVVYEDTPVIFLYVPTEKIIISKKWNGSATAKRPGYLANTFKPAK